MTNYESSQPEPTVFPLWMRSLALIVSVIFHPLLLLSYAFVLLAWSNPFLFGEASFGRVFQNDAFGLIFIRLFLFTFVVPLFAIMLMRFLGLVQSLQLSDRHERIGPYMIVGLFYMVTFVQYNNEPSIPMELKCFSLGATISIFAAFIINLFSKISMHTVGMGGFLGMVIMILAHSYAQNHYLFVLVVLAAGMVGTARLMLRAHEPIDVYGGYFVGFLAQFAALSFVYS